MKTKDNMMSDEDLANGLISVSSNVKLITKSNWYSFDNQRIHIFNLAFQLKINDGSLSDKQCIQEAKDFVAMFREMIIIKPL